MDSQLGPCSERGGEDTRGAHVVLAKVIGSVSRSNCLTHTGDKPEQRASRRQDVDEDNGLDGPGHAETHDRHRCARVYWGFTLGDARSLS